MPRNEPHPERLPGAEDATADEAKFVKYLLNPDHADGGPKARFFKELGFDIDNWQELRDQILSKLPSVAATFSRDNRAGGSNWTATIDVEGPEGAARVCTVWELTADAPPKFLTAYPDE